MSARGCKAVKVTCGTCAGSGKTIGLNKRTLAATTEVCGSCKGSGLILAIRKPQSRAA